MIKKKLETTGDHIADHYIYGTNYSDDCFSVLFKARSKQHLTFLEAIAITLYWPSLFSSLSVKDIGSESWKLSFFDASHTVI